MSKLLEMMKLLQTPRRRAEKKKATKSRTYFADKKKARKAQRRARKITRRNP